MLLFHKLNAIGMNKTIFCIALILLFVVCFLLFFVIKLKKENNKLRKEKDELNLSIRGFVVGSEVG